MACNSHSSYQFRVFIEREFVDFRLAGVLYSSLRTCVIVTKGVCCHLPLLLLSVQSLRPALLAYWRRHEPDQSSCTPAYSCASSYRSCVGELGPQNHRSEQVRLVFRMTMWRVDALLPCVFQTAFLAYLVGAAKLTQIGHCGEDLPWATRLHSVLETGVPSEPVEYHSMFNTCMKTIAREA